MANVLMAWELGEGTGAMSRLLAVAGGLAAHGHRPVFAVRDTEIAKSFLGGTPYGMVQAPLWVSGTVGPRRWDSSYADILALNGFGDVSALTSRIAAWRGLIELCEPGLIVGDPCPGLLLANDGTRPTVVVGEGIDLPPIGAKKFAKLDSTVEEIVPQDRILASIRKVQKSRKASAPTELPQILRADARFVCTLPDFDPYAGERDDVLAGPMSKMPKASKTPARARIVAFLDADFEGIESIVRGITELGLTAEICLPNPSPALRSLLEGRGLEVTDAVLPSARSIAAATIVVHHGDLPIVEMAMATGRPQIIVPCWRRQHWYASMVADRKIGIKLVTDGEIRDVGNVFRHFVESDTLAERAVAWAKTMSEDFARPGADTVVKKCLELLG